MSWRRGLKRIMATAPPVAVLAALALLPAAPADAHALVIGTDPAEGAVLDEPPAEVAVHFDTTPATGEGDPVQVYGPSGQRVDTGDARVVEGAKGGRSSTVSVTLDPDAALGRGSYHVAYRVVSLDTHLVTGYFTFQSENGAGAGPSAAGERSQAIAPPGRGTAPGAGGSWPKLFVTGATVVATCGLALRRHRAAPMGHRAAGGLANVATGTDA